MLWLCLGLLLLFPGIVLLLAHWHILRVYYPHLLRIFQEKPLFNIPHGQAPENAETVRFPTTGGLSLCGCYLATSKPRKGVILFGVEFGSKRWSCLPYCEFLRNEGFDIFSFEVRGQGESDVQPGYEPLQWVTNHEVEDYRAAIAYLKSRPDADPEGIGFFGISKGGSAGVLAAAVDSYVRCVVTDGIFATHTTMVPYMKKWVLIYGKNSLIIRALPDWYYRWIAHVGLKELGQQRGCRFPHLENAMSRLAPRPLLMIHGGADNYIRPEMARALFERARPPKEFILIDKAKHNQALATAREEYQKRVLAFFQANLASRVNEMLASQV